MITLPVGTTEAPAITYVAADSLQQIYLYEAGLFRPSIIDVVAQNGASSQYKVEFVVEKSNVATLQSISVAGVELADFVPTQFAYQYLLPVGTTVAPSISYVKGDQGQIVELITPLCDGEVVLKVISEDGSVTKTYTIELSFAPLTNSQLAGITLDGVLLDELRQRLIIIHYH